jgi:tRNA (guanine-N7-)-methyltransferase
MIQPQLIADLAEYCSEKTKIFVQSDVEEVAADICEKFEQSSAFRRIEGEKWMKENPFPVKTEREMIVEAQGLPVFRAMFEKR